MSNIDQKVYHIIGMSPGNSYFKDEEISYLLKTIVERFGRVAILVADIPAISTYVAFGYPENRARRDKAIPKGNALKNRVLKVAKELGYLNDIVRIIDWEGEVENNPDYKEKYAQVLDLYKNNKKFHAVASLTTRKVLEGGERKIEDLEKSTDIAVHYLLSELAFLEFAPQFLKTQKAVYVYHKNWEVYESYVSGKFDDIVRNQLDFLLIENPYETYNPIWGLEDDQEDESFADVLDRIEKTKILRVGFINYPPAFIHNEERNAFSGIFFEIISLISEKYSWQVRWTEEVGYGVIIEGLESNRFDMFGSTAWPTPERKVKADFSMSLYKSPAFAWVRADYGKTIEEIRGDKNIRVAVIENDITDSIVKADFPNNRQVGIPQLDSVMGALKFVAEDKADFTFTEPCIVESFNKNSAVELVPIPAKPIRVYENPFIFKLGEKRLKDFLDTELNILKQNGTITTLIKKYTESSDALIME
jgi:cyclo(L-tyrosyl-L-tyrosyl) synthase